MVTRTLVSIQEIGEIQPIEGADFIEAAKVVGMFWTVVVKKDEFSLGDKCVFCEVDSVLPDGAPWAEFMRPRKFRVKTCMLRKVKSQGLALPLDILKAEGVENPEELEIGTEVSELLKITKWEPLTSGGWPQHRSADTAGSFPSLIPKTDEIRIQSALGCLEDLRGFPYYITVKYDGQSGTFARINDEFMVCSRSRQIKEGDSNWWVVAKSHNLADKVPDGYAVQGEVCGPGIQKNRLMLPELGFFAFNVFHIEKGKFLGYEDFIAFCKEHEIPTVKVDEVGESFNYTVEELLAKAEGKYDGTKNRREGIVIRPQQEAYSPTLKGRLSFKTISDKFLLKDED